MKETHSAIGTLSSPSQDFLLLLSNIKSTCIFNIIAMENSYGLLVK